MTPLQHDPEGRLAELAIDLQATRRDTGLIPLATDDDDEAGEA